MIEDLSKSGIRRDVERYRGDRFRVESSPAWAARRKVMNIERRPGEPVSVLLMDRQIHAPSNSRYTRIVRRLETHQAVQDLGTVEIGFDPATQCLLVHGVSVFRAGNLENHAVESAFELFQREAGLEHDILNGAVTSLLVLKDIRVGDVLDLEFTVVSDSPLFGDHYWFAEFVGNTYPIGRQWLSWIEREGQDLHVKAPEGLGTYEREESANGCVRTWCFEHTAIATVEGDTPVTYKLFPEISITTFGGWDEVSALFLKPWSVEPADRDELEKELAPLRRRFEQDPSAAIAAAVDLVRHQVRYLGYSPGVFALVPADPAQVWGRRFGDCKEKSRLLCWILRELGVEADPVLVHTIGGAGLESTFPSPGAFNHVVTRVRHEGVELWVDPTDFARRGEVVGWRSLPFHFGLPLTVGSDRLVTIPAEPKGYSGLVVEEIVKVDPRNRGDTVTVTHTFRMSEADQVRHLMDSRGRAAVARFLTDLVRQTRPDAVSVGEMEVIDDPVANRFTLRCQFSCEELLRRASDGSCDILTLYPHSIASRVTGCSADRKQPLAIIHPADLKHTIRVVSDEARHSGIPDQIINNEFFRFSFTTTTTRTESIHVYTFQSLTGIVPAAKLRAYAADLTKLSSAVHWCIRFPLRAPKRFRMRPSDSSGAW